MADCVVSANASRLHQTQEVTLVEQLATSGRGIRRAAAYFRFRKMRSFFSANVYLRPASVMSF